MKKPELLAMCKKLKLTGRGELLDLDFNLLRSAGGFGSRRCGILDACWGCSRRRRYNNSAHLLLCMCRHCILDAARAVCALRHDKHSPFVCFRVRSACGVG